jgi:hypothetical protein
MSLDRIEDSIWILHKAMNRNQILFFVEGHVLTKRNSKEIWREVFLKPRHTVGSLGNSFLQQLAKRRDEDCFSLIYFFERAVFSNEPQRHKIAAAIMISSAAATFARRARGTVNASRVATPTIGAVRNLNVHGA